MSGSQQHGSWPVLNRGRASKVVSIKSRIHVKDDGKGPGHSYEIQRSSDSVTGINKAQVQNSK